MFRAKMPGIAVLLLAAILGAYPAAAQTLSEAQSNAVIDEVVKFIRRDYFVAAEREPIAAKLLAAKTAGRYTVSDARELADRLSDDLHAASSDKHLWFKLDADEYEGLRTAPNDTDPNAYDREQGRLHNQGYDELRILPGNLRYVDMSGFVWNGDVTKQAVADVARFLSGGDAVIVDLRHNPGGDQRAVQAFVSYFMPADNRLLMTFTGLGSPVKETRVLGNLPAPRMVAKPLYVLTSDGTASAAEEFAYHVKLFKLGTLVGVTTAGAGNNDPLYPIAPSFVFSLPAGRPVHPVSGTNWDGVGIAPDVETSTADALDQAQLLALQRLASRPGVNSQSYEWAISSIEAKLHPTTPDPAALADYAGRYGIRKITLENGHLFQHREGRPPVMLIPLAADVFVYANNDQIRARFHRTGGKISSYDMITSDGQLTVVPRDEP